MCNISSKSTPKNETLPKHQCRIVLFISRTVLVPSKFIPHLLFHCLVRLSIFIACVFFCARLFHSDMRTPTSEALLTTPLRWLRLFTAREVSRPGFRAAALATPKAALNDNKGDPGFLRISSAVSAQNKKRPLFQKEKKEISGGK
jgi:hypothetical protein